MDSGVLIFFSPVPSFPFPSFSLCCFGVVSALFHFLLFYFIFIFSPLAHSDAFNASRMMQVWLSVCGLTAHSQMVQMSCFVVREHGKLEMSL